ncbi:MAG TPA: hypothetical protein VK524_24240 [Polyangiaceae bacterium]|nr:hypothetical protein [Polyangiaceae bacterium]
MSANLAPVPDHDFETLNAQLDADNAEREQVELELEAMKTMAEQLLALDQPSRARVLRYLNERWNSPA